MPDLSIEPIRPGVSSNASIPDTTAASRANQQVFAQASQSINDLGKQYQATQDANALIAYKQRITELDNQMAFESDPKKIIPDYQNGQNKIQTELSKQYPSLSESGRKTIQNEMMNDLHAHVVRSANELHQQAEKDATDFHDNMVQLASKAKSKTEQDNLLNTGLNHYDELVKNNIWSPQHAQLQKTKLIKDVRESEAETLATDSKQSAVQFMHTTAEQLGISSAKWHSLFDVAAKTLNTHETAGYQKYQLDRDAAYDSATSENAQKLYSARLIDQGYASYLLGHPPKEPKTQDEVDADTAAPFLNNIYNAQTKDEVDKVKMDAINHGIKGMTKNLLTVAAERQKASLTEANHDAAVDVVTDLKDTLSDPKLGDPTYGQSSLLSLDLSNKNWNERILRDAARDTLEAKTAKEKAEVKTRYHAMVLDRYKDQHGAGTTGTGTSTAAPANTDPDAD